MNKLRNPDMLMRASVITLTAVIFILCTITVGVALTRDTSTDQSPTMTATASFARPQAASIVHESQVFDTLSLQARSAIVVDLNTGEAIFERNAETALPLASITKLATAVTAAELISNPAEKTTTLTAGDIATEGEYGLSVGEAFNLQELIDVMLVISSNDAAMAVARASKGSVENFVKEMNTLVKRVQMSDTSFSNPSGLDIDPRTAGAYGSAKDIAKLMRYALQKYPDVLAASRKTSIVVGTKQHRYSNTNEIVGDLSGVLISKTGFTDLAGGNLAVAFDAGVNKPFAIVVLGSTQDGRFSDVAQLASSTHAYLAEIKE